MMRLREFISNNFWFKLVSVTLAMMIWVTIYTSIQGKVISRDSRVVTGMTVTFPLAITVVTAAADSRGFTVTPSEVEVTVRGEESVMERLKKTDVQAQVNLVDVKEARGLKKTIRVHTPTNVTLISVTPEEVTVERVPAGPAPVDSKQD